MIEITEDRFNQALNAVASTEDGQIVLCCLKEFCAFDGDIVSGSLEATYANAALRRAYLYLRGRIRAEHLKKIEFNYKRKAIEHERRSRRNAAAGQRHPTVIPAEL